MYTVISYSYKMMMMHFPQRDQELMSITSTPNGNEMHDERGSREKDSIVEKLSKYARKVQ